MTTITGASIVFTFSVDTYSPAPTTIQGYSPDATVDGESMAIAEVMKGIDGFGSAGFINTTLVTPFELIADQPSCAFIDGWAAAMKVLNGGTGDILYARNGVITYPGLGLKAQATQGVLRNWKPIPTGQKLLRPRQFTIEWIQWSPMTTI